MRIEDQLLIKYIDSNIWQNTYWMGIKVSKCPLDLHIYQEIIYNTKPDIIIECGTCYGGSSLFMANIMDLIGHGEIITIDINPLSTPKHDRITYLKGYSTEEKIVNKVKEKSKNKRTMVILDSDHHMENVYKELIIYSELVSSGCYLIVEDTCINGHPVRPNCYEGPMEALEKWLPNNNNFYIDSNCEKFFISFNPKGYLIKK